jgi:plastocyanin
MKKNLLIFLLFSFGTVCFCTTHLITNAGTTFTPAAITITLGDSVNFSLGGIHNAVEVSKATWDANDNTPLPGFSVPFGGGLVLPAQLTTGTHYYVCTPHASIGMKGTIIVQSASEIIENPMNTSVSIYPNPSNGEFQLEINGSRSAKNFDLSIYDLKGDKVYAASDRELQNSYNIDLSALPKGIYLVKINSGAELFCRKIVVQ